MNKKLLSSTALVSALMISGAALAEFKIGGDVTATVTMGSDDSSSTATGSGEHIGNETNLMMSGTKDLSGGLKATYTGKLEFDGVTSANPDHEYELKIASGDFYVAFANDNGQSNRTSMTPFVSYPIGSTALAVSPGAVAFNGDSYISGVHQSNNIAIGGKVGTGNVVFRYAPSVSNIEGDDIQTGGINASTGTENGSGMMFAYNGKFGPVGLNLGYTTQKLATESGSANDDAKEQRIGLSYDIAGAKIGADYIKFESGHPAGSVITPAADGRSTSFDRNTVILGIAYPASKEVTIGAYYQTTEDDTAVTTTADEDVKMISVGYNLGGGSIALSVIDVENRFNLRGDDSQGLMITTKVGF
jgi:predicted porin